VIVSSVTFFGLLSYVTGCSSALCLEQQLFTGGWSICAPEVASMLG
jgi:hypothetical protein